jgi:homoserine kinase
LVGADLPLETEKMSQVFAGDEALNSDAGFESEIYKNIKAGSGIGSSAASSAGAVFKSMNY